MVEIPLWRQVDLDLNYSSFALGKMTLGKLEFFIKEGDTLIPTSLSYCNFLGEQYKCNYKTASRLPGMQWVLNKCYFQGRIQELL